MTLIEQVAAIEARADAATKGPWRAYLAYKDPHRLDRGVMLAATAVGHQVRTDAECGTRPSLDMDFIAAARQDVPSLCRALRLLAEAATDVDAMSWDYGLGSHRTIIKTRAALAEASRILAEGR
jgi:hypothetical protein